MIGEEARRVHYVNRDRLVNSHGQDTTIVHGMLSFLFKLWKADGVAGFTHLAAVRAPGERLARVEHSDSLLRANAAPPRSLTPQAARMYVGPSSQATRPAASRRRRRL